MKNWLIKDMHSKLNSAESSSNNSIFKSSGIQAFTIGNCDSHIISTRLFWWTNHSTNVRKELLQRRQTNNISSIIKLRKKSK